MNLHSKGHFDAKVTSLVTVRITDVNDNMPRFESTFERVVISEDLPVGSSIAVVRVVDQDTVGFSSKLQYILEEVLLSCSELSSDIICCSPFKLFDSLYMYLIKVQGNNNGTFKIDQETGWLTLLKEVDREVVEEYALIVSARDEGGQSTRKKIVVVIKDVNDSPPQFSKEIYSVQQYIEQIDVGQSILELQVHVRDLVVLSYKLFHTSVFSLLPYHKNPFKIISG